ncbi:MAG: hypothetical protein GXP01_11350 [Alphaproteobacteria bacterium]|nr:hypothetical protein [Alphaproteobacteria bacterium]
MDHTKSQEIVTYLKGAPKVVTAARRLLASPGLDVKRAGDAGIVMETEARKGAALRRSIAELEVSDDVRKALDMAVRMYGSASEAFAVRAYQLKVKSAPAPGMSARQAGAFI